jgi:16S rRNA (cytosine967-C5)-methyltransferase
LENASKYLKQEGRLVYSTCTTNNEENIELVNEFLNKNKEFILCDISDKVDEYFTTAKDGYIEIYPHVHSMDGFFIAKLKRV